MTVCKSFSLHKVCCVYRDTYSLSELPGGKRGRFRLKDEIVERHDITLVRLLRSSLTSLWLTPSKPGQNKFNLTTSTVRVLLTAI